MVTCFSWLLLNLFFLPFKCYQMPCFPSLSIPRSCCLHSIFLLSLSTLHITRTFSSLFFIVIIVLSSLLIPHFPSRNTQSSFRSGGIFYPSPQKHYSGALVTRLHCCCRVFSLSRDIKGMLSVLVFLPPFCSSRFISILGEAK